MLIGAKIKQMHVPLIVFLSICVSPAANSQGGKPNIIVVERPTLTGMVAEVIDTGKPLPRQKFPQDMTLTLIDGATGAERGVVADAIVIDRSTFVEKGLASFSVRADLPGKGAKSVQFYINDSPAGRDLTEPFTLFGDAANTKDRFNRQTLPGKGFMLRAVAFAGSKADGPVLSDKSVYIDVK